MSWAIKCGNGGCASETWVQNIHDLKQEHCDPQGWFLCGTCGSRGYIPKRYDLQEGGEPWKPYLQGIIQPNGYGDDGYQPFAFLTSDSPDEAPTAIWFLLLQGHEEERRQSQDGVWARRPSCFSDDRCCGIRSPDD